MGLNLVVFDMAGTTIVDNGVVNRCFRDALAEYGLAVRPEAVDAVMGLPKPEAFRRLVAGSPLAASLIHKLESIHDTFVSRMVDHYRDDPGVAGIPGAEELFAKLHDAGVKVALDTGFSRPIADVILDRLGWSRGAQIDGSVTSDEVERGRPAPDMIQHLMKMLEIDDASSVAKVGDAPADLEEGSAAGCGWVIGVTWGTHTRAQLAPYPHTHLVDSIDRLGELLLGIHPTR